MSVQEVKAWLLTTKSIHAESIKFELDLIDRCEKAKHKHFSPKMLRMIFSEMPSNMQRSLMEAVHLAADSQNITLRSDDHSSDKFFEIFIKYLAPKSMAKLRKEFIKRNISTDELDQLDSDGRCIHDVDMDSRIESSLEYITTLIKGKV